VGLVGRQGVELGGGRLACVFAADFFLLHLIVIDVYSFGSRHGG